MTDSTSPAGGDLQVQIQVRLIEALQEREHQLAKAQRLARIGSWSWDLRSGDVYCSDELLRISGRPPKAPALGQEDFVELVHADHRERFRAVLQEASHTDVEVAFEGPIVVPGGQERWVHVTAAVDRDVNSDPVRMHGVIQDRTDAHAAEETIDELSALFEALVENTSDVLMILNADGTIRYTSPSGMKVLGHVAGSQVARSFLELIHPDDVAIAISAAAEAAEAPPGSATSAEVRIAHADGTWRTFEASTRNLTTDDAIRGFLITSRDITERKNMELRLEHQALHDPLTGLPNRTLLTELAVAALARATRRGWNTSLVAIDVDEFGAINSRYGFDAGDQVLIEVAARLEDAFRPPDPLGLSSGSIVRAAADQFLVVGEQVDPEAVEALGLRVASVFQEPFRVADDLVEISASTGIAVAPPGSSDFGALLHEAETALRIAKTDGGGACELFDHDLRSRQAVRSDAKKALQRAIDNGELRLFFQPKVSLATDRIVGAEGLLRWDDPSRGLVPPLEFIPLAEETGLIVPIGGWVIEEACRRGAVWQRDFPDRPPLVVHVNVSTRQFGPALVKTVASALAATGLPAERLGLEVTESILLDDADSAASTLHDLKEMGVSLSIDDFGTGYSSLAYLKQLDLHELKIDKSFIDGLGEDAGDSAIVAAVIALAHALGLEVVAEGIETVAQLERLKSMGCDIGQGYYFAKPVPVEAMDQLLRDEASASWRSAEGTPVDDEAGDHYRADRVLIVDDSPEIRQLASISLTAVGFQVYEAADGLAGVEAAKRVAPDCILLDLNMPGLNGTDACRALRSDPATADCTIIMLTANTDAADKVGAFSSGADDYIIKPFSPRDLSARIHSAMRRRREQVAASAGSETDGGG